MNRRAFLHTITLVAGATVLPWKFTNAEERNWDAFRVRLRDIAARGYEIEAFALDAQRTVFVRFYVKWEKATPESSFTPKCRTVRF